MNSQKSFWPYGIVLTFAIFICGTAALIVIAGTHQTDLIAANYYEQEIRYQGQLDRIGRARQLDQHASVSYNAGQQQITVSLPPEQARDATGSIYFYRPSAAGLDQHVKLKLNSNGAQTIDTTPLRAGLWKVKVLWNIGGEEYFIDEKVNVKS